jgi:CBS domain containing-hemolysin-like protein
LRPQLGLTEDEYLTMLDVSTQEGTLRPAERRLIERTLALADHRLRELMVPRSEMRCLDAEMDLESMKAQARSMQHRRLPIFSDSLDSIVGVLNVKRLLVNPEADVIDCIEPAGFVPETMVALELLKSFLRGPQRLAIVVDEFGGVEGLITLEDILEEVFGEIYDEYDAALLSWEEIEPGTFLVHGQTRLTEISAWLKVRLKAEGVDTLGGWLADRLGALPRVGDRVVWRGYSFQVEKMNRLVVDRLLLRNERRKS